MWDNWLAARTWFDSCSQSVNCSQMKVLTYHVLRRGDQLSELRNWRCVAKSRNILSLRYTGNFLTHDQFQVQELHVSLDLVFFFPSRLSHLCIYSSNFTWKFSFCLLLPSWVIKVSFQRHLAFLGAFYLYSENFERKWTCIFSILLSDLLRHFLMILTKIKKRQNSEGDFFLPRYLTSFGEENLFNYVKEPRKVFLVGLY